MGEANVASKDIVIAALGAAAALAGFILVFLGVIISNFLSFPPETKDMIRGPYLWEGWLSMVAFFLSVGTVALGLVWLVYGQSSGVYDAVIWLLFIDLALVFVVGVITTFQALKE